MVSNWQCFYPLGYTAQWDTYCIDLVDNFINQKKVFTKYQMLSASNSTREEFYSRVTR